MPITSSSCALAMAQTIHARQPALSNTVIREATMTLDARLRVLHASAGISTLLGFSRWPGSGEVLTKVCSDKALLDTIADATMTALPQKTMIVRTGRDGIERQLQVQVIPTGMTPSGVVVLVCDAAYQNCIEDQLITARTALDGMSEALVVVDTAGWQIQQVNARAMVMLDLDGSELQDMSFDRIRLRMRTEEGSMPQTSSLLPMTRYSGEFRYVRDHGPALPIELRSTILRLQHRELLVLVFRDLTERVHAASELRGASARCGITFHQAATGLAHVTLEGRWSKVNRKLTSITGYSEEELLGLSVSQVTHPDDITNETIAYQRLLDGELSHYTREKRYVRKDGMHVWVSVTSSLARNDDGEPLYFIGMVEDISERKRAEERIHYLANHDVMTGLPNRHGLQDHLETTLELARQNGLKVGVVFVDMDKLKQINDTLGHEEGDAALIRFARQLQQQVRSDDMVARIGGDEFVIVLDNVISRADITAVLERTLFTVTDARNRSAHTISPSCSIGISVFPDDGDDSRTLIRNADTAMYRAKQGGGSQYEFFSDDTNAGGGLTTKQATYAGKK